MAKPRLHEIKFADFSWIHITHPTELETNQLEHGWGLNPLDLRDVLPPIQRPKLTEREKYLFMILLYPLYERASRKIHPVEIDFFISRNFLITAASEEFSPVSDFFNHHKKKIQNADFKTPADLFYEILKRLEHYCLPMSTHISNDIDRVENEVFSSTSKQETINEVLRIKTNIVNFRKAMNRHNRVIEHLAAKTKRFFPEFSGDLFKSLVEDAEDLWEMLENYHDTIHAIHESQLSLLNYRSNVIMQIFTIMTTIIFSLEMVIGIISLGTDTSLSFYNKPLGLLVVFGSLFLVFAAMIIFFKKKRWI
ncbi:MAG: hypothetical protein HY982_01595 [Candidatus Magasanikbacteria bacterium]|nr:hypothetical protein [Candidatus Magasanikbacteria bacterium]